MAEYTITTTPAQDATLAWYMTHLHGESIPLAAVTAWMQEQIDAIVRDLMGQKLTTDIQELTNAYRAKPVVEQDTLRPQLRTLLGLE